MTSRTRDATTTGHRVFGLIAVAGLTVAACGGDDDEAAPETATPPPTAVATAETSASTESAAPPTASAPTTPPTAAPTTAAPPETTVPPTTIDDQRWRDQVDDLCAQGVSLLAIPEPSGDQASLEAYVQAIRDGSPSFAGIDVPPGPGRTPEELAAIAVSRDAALDGAAAGAAAGDAAAMWDGVDSYFAHLGAFASAFAAAGQTCGPADAERAAEADLNVTIVSPWQIEVGFDSVWASQQHTDTVARIDPDSGEIVATIDMPSLPLKLQPADGRMVVRTEDSYVAIDAATNTVVDRLLKSDVGPNANRSWAVDGAMWICDGQRFHRYDPATFGPVAAIELDFECGQPFATSELAVAFTYNEDPGDSGFSRAAFVDPATNSVVAAVDLAGDPNVPVVLDHAVFFPPALGSHATVVDRSTWTIATSDLGREVDGGSQPAFDGTYAYVITDKPTGEIAVIDPTTYEVVDTLHAIATAPSLNSLAATPGVVWAANNSGGLLQRFDTGAGPDQD